MAKTDTEWTWATGRRKEATAQVRITPGKGQILVNKRDFDVYFDDPAARGYINQVLETVDSVNAYDIRVTVKGGGKIGQAGAMRHGIARAIIKYDPTTRTALKAKGMLTRDAREKERKKPGQPGARKRFQFSKR